MLLKYVEKINLRFSELRFYRHYELLLQFIYRLIFYKYKLNFSFCDVINSLVMMLAGSMIFFRIDKWGFLGKKIKHYMCKYIKKCILMFVLTSGLAGFS